MSVIVLLIVAGGVVAAGFLGAFAWAVRSGQYDDTCTPAVRVLLEDSPRLPAIPSSSVRDQEGRAYADADH
jgi:cbb3-type cytochrome oxidase maturation protein